MKTGDGDEHVSFAESAGEFASTLERVEKLTQDYQQYSAHQALTWRCSRAIAWMALVVATAGISYFGLNSGYRLTEYDTTTGRTRTTDSSGFGLFRSSTIHDNWVSLNAPATDQPADWRVAGESGVGLWTYRECGFWGSVAAGIGMIARIGEACRIDDEGTARLTTYALMRARASEGDWGGGHDQMLVELANTLVDSIDSSDKRSLDIADIDTAIAKAEANYAASIAEPSAPDASASRP